MARQIVTEMFLVAIIGLILGLLGPFGSYQMPWAIRLAYWVGCGLIGYAIFRPMTIVAEWLHHASILPDWLCKAFAMMIAAIPMTFLLVIVLNGRGYDPALFSAALWPFYLQVVGIGTAIYIISGFLFSQRQAGILAPADDMSPIKDDISPIKRTNQADAAPLPRLHKRLPIGFPADIIALGVEDHYVRVYAAARSAMLLLRLADAIAEMDIVAGHKVHRSWWVARHGVARVERDGRNIRLVLVNDITVPVSRNNVAKLKQSGWVA